VHANARPATGIAACHRHLDVLELGWVRKQVPEANGDPVAQDRSLPAREHGRHLPGQGWLDRPHQVHGAMKRTQPILPEAPVDRPGLEAELEEL
jgi:hypothetical protein